MNPQDGQVVMVNGERLKAVMTHNIEFGLIDCLNLVDPVYHDWWVGPCLAKDIKLSTCWEAT